MRKLTAKHPVSISDCLYHLEVSKARTQLEQFRIEYEKLHGKTDLTKRYTTTWPDEQQNWLMKHDITAYFEGMPPFAQDFIKQKLKVEIQSGRGDDIDDSLLRLYFSGVMDKDKGSDGRAR